MATVVLTDFAWPDDVASEVADLVASLTLPQVRSIAFASARELRVRWDQDPEFCRALLIAALTSDEQAM